MNQHSTSSMIGRFEMFSVKIEEVTLANIGQEEIAYVEAEYFGGEGGQQVIFWRAGKRQFLTDYGQDKINEVLRLLGVRPSAGLDEFDTVGLSKHRFMLDWLEEAEK